MHGSRADPLRVLYGLTCRVSHGATSPEHDRKAVERAPDCRRQTARGCGGTRTRLAGGRFRAQPREHGRGGEFPLSGLRRPAKLP